MIGGSIMVDQTVLSSKIAAKKVVVGTPAGRPQADSWDDPKWKAWEGSASSLPARAAVGRSGEQNRSRGWNQAVQSPGSVSDLGHSRPPALV